MSVSTTDGFNITFSVVVVVVGENKSVIRNESLDWLNIFVIFEILSSGVIEARRLAISSPTWRRGRIVSKIKIKIEI